MTMTEKKQQELIKGPDLGFLPETIINCQTQPLSEITLSALLTPVELDFLQGGRCP
jgi:hypothetical protein